MNKIADEILVSLILLVCAATFVGFLALTAFLLFMPTQIVGM